MKTVDAYRNEAARLRTKADELKQRARGAESLASKIEALARVRVSLAELKEAAEKWRGDTVPLFW